ncbi:MAG TPA: DnaJ domain-containing protein, partial [Pirellulales bacterium]|nr:DnaJ domain-containing protein [Pirellulales bacterium]
MAEDYYKTLEVSRDADAEAIEKAYAKLARKYHPDLNPDDKTAKKKFQQVQAAYDVLKDAKKRQMYDRYGSAYEQAAASGGARPGGGQAWSQTVNPEDFDFAQFFGGETPGGFGDLFTQFRRGRAGGRRTRGGERP